jgi:hypothetical protein
MMRFVFAALLSLCCASLAAAAKDGVKVSGGISEQLLAAFRAMDVDGDGYISRTEAAKDPRTSKLFAQADRNGDGRLDVAEFKSAAPTGFSDPYTAE